MEYKHSAFIERLIENRTKVWFYYIMKRSDTNKWETKRLSSFCPIPMNMRNKDDNKRKEATTVEDAIRAIKQMNENGGLKP